MRRLQVQVAFKCCVFGLVNYVALRVFETEPDLSP